MADKNKSNILTLQRDVRVIRDDLDIYNQSIAETLLQITKAILKNSEDIANFRGEAIGRFADVMGELKTIREELVILPHQVSGNSQRIDVVESKLGIVT